jgi:hypothetical protein
VNSYEHLWFYVEPHVLKMVEAQLLLMTSLVMSNETLGSWT